MRNYFKGFLAVLTMLSFYACTKGADGCFVPKQFYVQVGFKLIDSIYREDSLGRPYYIVENKDTPLNFPSLLTLAVDSAFLIKSGDRAIATTLPLNPESNTIQYRFQPDSTNLAFDTVTLYYTHDYYFISNACGYSYSYHIDSVITTNHFLKNININKRDVTNKATDKHLQFYFKKQP